MIGGRAEPTAGPVLVSLGSNIEPRTNLAAAVRLLAQRCRVVSVSRVYRTPAVGGNGPDFLNAAASIETRLAPARLKSTVLRSVEDALGRERQDDRFAPRTIDLDLVLYGSLILPAGSSPADIELPDPDLLRWAHVAVPLADVAPDARHPVDGRTLREIALSLSGAGIEQLRVERLALLAA